MASTFISPGVYFRELDQSLYISALQDTVLGVVGTATWGPVGIPTLVTSMDQFQQVFGLPLGLDTGAAYPNNLTVLHPMMYALQRYFRRGRRAYVTRIFANDGTNAVQNGNGPVSTSFTHVHTINDDTGVAVYKVWALYPGSYGDVVQVKVSNGTSTPGPVAPAWQPSANYPTAGATDPMSIVRPTVDNGHIYQVTTGGANSGLVEPVWPVNGTNVTVAGITYKDVGQGNPWTASIKYNVGALITPTTANGHIYIAISVTGGANSGAVEPTWVTDGTTVTDNEVTWRDLGAQTKKLTVYVGSPYDAGLPPNLRKLKQVEVFDNLVQHDATSNDFWLKRVGEALTNTDTPYGPASTRTDPPAIQVSRYIALEKIGSNAHQPVNTAIQGNATSAGNDTRVSADGIPAASDSAAVNGNQYILGLGTMADTEIYPINILCIPGVSRWTDTTFGEVAQGTIDAANGRGDAIAIVDPPFNKTVQGVIDWHNQPDGDPASILNNNYGALYYPWIQVNDDLNGAQVFIPPSSFALECYAYTDYLTEPWFAPAGIQRGSLQAILRAERTVTQGDIDSMYGQGNAVNALRTFSGTGVVIWGQRTLQRIPTALDRVNVRRLLLTIRRLIANSVRVLTFEPDDPVLWRKFVGLVTPFLQSVQDRRGITAFRVICDSTTNTPEVIEQNMMIGKVFIKPTKTAEIIVVDFVLTSQGTTFNEALTATVQ